MSIQDFLFGEPDQAGQLDPRIQSARNFLLQEMLNQYAAGPINVPTYQAVIPQNMYSGTNDLLSSLGFSPVSIPSMPTTNIGGIEAYTTQPIQEAMQGQSSVGGDGSYGSFQGSGVAGVGTGGSGSGSSSGGGGAAIPLGASRVPYSTLTQPQLDAYSQDIADSVGMDVPFDPYRTAREQMTDAQYAAFAGQSAAAPAMYEPNNKKGEAAFYEAKGGLGNTKGAVYDGQNISFEDRKKVPPLGYLTGGASMSDKGQQAAEAIYRSNLANSGSGYGGSLTTGRASGGNLFQNLLGGAQSILDIPLLGDIAGMTVAGRLAQSAIDNYSTGDFEFDPSDPSTFVTASGRNANEAFSTPSGGGLFANILSRTPSPNPNQAAADQAARIAAPSAGVEKARQAATNTLAAQSRAAANPAQIKAKRAQGMALSAAEQAAVNAASAGGLGWMYM